MKPGYILFVMFTAPLGLLLATRVAMAPAKPAGMTCAAKTLVAFGYTHKQVALAELAAIVTWQGEAEESKPGFSAWHLAKKRVMNCRQFKNSAHFQCVVSAKPCRMDRN